MSRFALLAAVVWAGCYSPSIPNGVQACAPGGHCGDGYQCGPDNRCYLAGQLPSDGGARDQAIPRDLAGADLTGADLAGGDGAVADIATTHDLVMPCANDGECGGTTPRCDPATKLCVPCLPTNDNCTQGYFCTMANGTWACEQGCKVDGDCSGDGGLLKCCANRCVDTLSDGANCGGCNVACGAKACCAGSCTDTTSDIANCGACGKACTGKNANWSCSNKTCAVSSCKTNFGDCNMMSSDGCEVNDQTDASNCGSCGKVCSSNHVTASCAAGACSGACAAGYADCNGNKQGDGCEIQVNGSDVLNCGACAKVCSTNNIARTCAGGVCNGNCSAGFGDCNGNKQSDGCEVDLLTDKNNCGGCGKPCNGTCMNGVCGMVGCRTAVLVISDGAAQDQQLSALLAANGLQPTLAVNTTYAGMPDASGFGSVIILDGVNYSTDMPLAGQSSIAAATNGGTGVVFFEWASYETIGMRFATLKPLMAMIYTTGVTSTTAPVYANTVGHAVWTGLPASFAFANVSEGLSLPALVNGGVTIATYSCTGCTAGTPAVAVRDTGVYRVVSDASSPNYGADTSTWTVDPNRMKLMVNMAKWAGHCL